MNTLRKNQNQRRIKVIKEKIMFNDHRWYKDPICWALIFIVIGAGLNAVAAILALMSILFN